MKYSLAVSCVFALGLSEAKGTVAGEGRLRKTAVVVMGGFSPIAGRFHEDDDEAEDHVIDAKTEMFVRLAARTIRRNVIDVNRPSIVVIHSWNPELEALYEEEYQPEASIYEKNKAYESFFMKAPGCRRWSHTSSKSACWKAVSWTYSAYRGVGLAEAQPGITHVIIVRPDVIYTKPIAGAVVPTKVSVGIPFWPRRACGDFFYVFSLEAALKFVHMYTTALNTSTCVVGCIQYQNKRAQPDRQCYKSMYIKNNLNMTLYQSRRWAEQPLDFNIYRNIGISGGNCHFLFDYPQHIFLDILAQINFTATHLQAIVEGYAAHTNKNTTVCPKLVAVPLTNEFRRSIDPIVNRLSPAGTTEASTLGKGLSLSNNAEEPTMPLLTRRHRGPYYPKSTTTSDTKRKVTTRGVMRRKAPMKNSS